MIRITHEGFKILQHKKNEEYLYIDSDKLFDCVKFIHENDIQNIIIDRYNNYKADDIEFLLDLKEVITGLVITDNHYSYSPVASLKRLRNLSILDNGKDVVDLSLYKNLVHCNIQISSRLLGLGQCASLKDLQIVNFKFESLLNLPELKHLERLTLIKTSINSLLGIEKYINLKRLDISYASKLNSINPIEKLSNSLLEIELQNCKKIQDFDSMGCVKSLKKMILSECGSVSSLSFLSDLNQLKFLSFWGTNILDGDLSFCEKIDYVGFDNKRHYSHKFEDFNK